MEVHNCLNSKAGNSPNLYLLFSSNLTCQPKYVTLRKTAAVHAPADLMNKTENTELTSKIAKKKSVKRRSKYVNDWIVFHLTRLHLYTLNYYTISHSSSSHARLVYFQKKEHRAVKDKRWGLLPWLHWNIETHLNTDSLVSVHISQARLVTTKFSLPLLACISYISYVRLYLFSVMLVKWHAPHSLSTVKPSLNIKQQQQA